MKINDRGAKRLGKRATEYADANIPETRQLTRKYHMGRFDHLVLPAGERQVAIVSVP